MKKLILRETHLRRKRRRIRRWVNLFNFEKVCRDEEMVAQDHKIYDVICKRFVSERVKYFAVPNSVSLDTCFSSFSRVSVLTSFGKQFWRSFDDVLLAQYFDDVNLWSRGRVWVRSSSRVSIVSKKTLYFHDSALCNRSLPWTTLCLINF